MKYSRWLSPMVLLLLALQGMAGTVTVSAAVSLKEALAEVGKSYEKEKGDEIRLNVGGSGQLMEQIQNGAPVDLFVSAGVREVEELEKAGKVVEGSRKVVARNRLVLVVPAGKGEGIGGFLDLGKEGVKRVAVGKPGVVPAGDYAGEVFEHLNMTDAMKGKLVYGANVRQVLDYVKRGEVDAGVVYTTDAMEAGDAVKVAAVAEEGWHRPIEYVGVVVKGAKEGAGGFLEYLGGETAREVLKKKGFEGGGGK